ncbi:hypothetical protein GALMADRAFT_231888 [Galerina marginata CBS 339.88]|uniref:Uncharacterized protein n=1 Tax=Galerina marginata (strain CBS 339.88) TaxID=685588 RepID=A0A067SLQ9_GALM3|nr:hypothetical protein GALMADRAFT_231888 [Galerina marginata CBS 339.88]
MPVGSKSEDLGNSIRLRKYVAANAESWYRYVNEVRGREARNGDVRLVMGYDKTTAWGMATFANTTAQESRLKFKPMGETGVGRTYGWEYSGMAEGRTGPDPEELEELRMGEESELGSVYENQCLFIRTLNITLQAEIWDKLAADLDLEMLDVHNILVMPNVYQGSTLSRTPGGTTASGATQSGSSFSPTARASDRWQDSPVIYNVSDFTSALASHPSNQINKQLLEQVDAKVIITEDRDWISVLSNDDLILPSPNELYCRIMDLFSLTVENGTAFLSPLSSGAPSVSRLGETTTDSSKISRTEPDAIFSPSFGSFDPLAKGYKTYGPLLNLLDMPRTAKSEPGPSDGLQEGDEITKPSRDRDAIPFEEHEPYIAAADETSSCGTCVDNSGPGSSRNSLPLNQKSVSSVPVPTITSDQLYHNQPDGEYSGSTVKRTSRISKDLDVFAFGSQFSPGSSKRSIEWNEDHDATPNPASLPIVSVHNTNANPLSSNQISATDSFDLSWLQEYGVNSVVGIDPSKMAGVLDQSDSIQHRHSFYPFRRDKSATNAQQSTFSSHIDSMHEDSGESWVSQNDRIRQRMWAFTKGKERSDDGANNSASQSPHRPTARAKLFDFLRPNHKTGTTSFSGKSRNKEQEKAVVNENLWFNGLSGKFIIRRNAIPVESGEHLEQELNIQSYNVSDGIDRDATDGPAVTICRHSKAVAFSISRHYHTNPSSNSIGQSVNSVDPLNSVLWKTSVHKSRKKSNTVLLGTLRVHQAYTSTNTTSKLQSHGLLDDNSGRTSPVQSVYSYSITDAPRKARSYDLLDDVDLKGKQRTSSEGKGNEDKWDKSQVVDIRPANSRSMEKSMAYESVDNPASALDLPDISASSTGDVATIIPRVRGALANGLSDSTSLHMDGNTSSTISLNTFRRHQSRRGIYDIDDDTDDEESRHPALVPHSETYWALSPEIVGSALQAHQHTGVFGRRGWKRSKDSESRIHPTGPYLELSYKPPWTVISPPSDSKTDKGVADDSNASFKHVGLLPLIRKIKSFSKSDQKHGGNISDESQIEVFKEIPEGAFCMLLPLWPDETDPNSSAKHPYSSPPISIDARQYALIYWKAHTPPPSNIVAAGSNKPKSGGKKRSHDSPIALSDSTDDRVVLFSPFHISARVVAYRDLQGSGVRIPDVGLAVSGPLEDAYKSIPSSAPKEDYVIGICDSQESCIEFLPEGFQKMGLSRTKPAEFGEDDGNPSLDSIPVPTPIGRVVMEMAWLGSIALTSL